MRTIEERYNFLIQRLKVTNPDYWEGDALLEMKPFCFGFDIDTPEEMVEVLQDVEKAIDLAIDTAEWDAKHGINK